MVQILIQILYCFLFRFYSLIYILDLLSCAAFLDNAKIVLMVLLFLVFKFKVLFHYSCVKFMMWAYIFVVIRSCIWFLLLSERIKMNLLQYLWIFATASKIALYAVFFDRWIGFFLREHHCFFKPLDCSFAWYLQGVSL